MKNKRLCVHLHFAAPEAEKTWTGEPEEDAASWPFRNPWERFFHRWTEPYLDGLRTDADGLILDSAGSLGAAGFSFSPDFLAWIVAHRPGAARRILEADARSLTETGHGAALAALPESPPGGRVAALASSLEDFQRRFGRKAEGVWLGGAAAPALLDAAAGLGLRFALASASPEDAGGHLPLRWEAGDLRLAVFFPDPALSDAAERGLLAPPGRGLALRLAGRFSSGDCAELVLLALRADRFSEDGRRGNRLLLEAFSEISGQEVFQAASPAEFLDLFPPPRKLDLSFAPDGGQGRPPAAPAAEGGGDAARCARGARPRSEDRVPWDAARAAFLDHLRGTLGLFRSRPEDIPPFELFATARLRRKTRKEELGLTLCRIAAGTESFLSAVLHRGRLDIGCFLLPGADAARCAQESTKLSAVFESEDAAALERALSALAGPCLGLDVLPPLERRRAVLDLLPPAGAKGEALRRWREALAALASGKDSGQSLGPALEAALAAGIPRQSLSEVPWLRARARESAGAFARGGAPGPLKQLLVLLELLGPGLGSDLGEFGSAGLEGLRAADRGARRRAPERSRLAALLGISSAVFMRPPRTRTPSRPGTSKAGGNG